MDSFRIIWDDDTYIIWESRWVYNVSDFRLVTNYPNLFHSCLKGYDVCEHQLFSCFLGHSSGNNSSITGKNAITWLHHALQNEIYWWLNSINNKEYNWSEWPGGSSLMKLSKRNFIPWGKKSMDCNRTLQGDTRLLGHRIREALRGRALEPGLLILLFQDRSHSVKYKDDY